MPPPTDLLFMPATEAAARIRRRQLSPVEYLDAVLAHAEAQQPRLNPFMTVCAERAREEARAAERAVMAGDRLGPLHGVPVHVKDLFATAGIRTTHGSAIFADNVPDHDDVLVTRLRAAGAVVFAKSTTPEFGHKGMTDGPSFGITRNPWDLGRNAGGSSGGAAAAVAAGIGPLGLGTDGAGSIRIPAAYCGVVGLKPTTGAVPFQGSVDAFSSYAAAGPLARTVSDAALMQSTLVGADPCDPWTLAAPDFGRLTPRWLGRDLAGLRIGYFPRMANRLVARDVEANTLAALAVYQARGAVVEEVADAIDWIEKPGRAMYQGNIAVAFGKYVEEWGDRMDPVLLAFIEWGKAYTLADFRSAQYARTRLFRSIQGLFERYDVLMSPTLTRTALPVDFDAAHGQVEVDGQPNGITREGMSPYAYPFNLTGHPAVSVPSGWASDGLPTSLQIVGPWWSDLDMLRLAAVLEEDRPWADRRPPLA
ncbi:MAG: amidase [Thalassobaculum sp.]|uniref:amidase n=1 Tax=Thalassobaculum sp. TaxID=2022740 RepID=UPI0032EB9FF6